MRQVFLMILLMFVFTSIVFADANSNRYTITEPVSGEPIVKDEVTGLIWQKNYVGYKTWEQTLRYCESVDYAGQTDWRLPDIHQLVSLRTLGRIDPATYFPDMPSEKFWSSTPTKNSMTDSRILFIDFQSGKISGGVTPYQYFVRCVRDDS